jgi:hypothetical protein
MRKVHHKFAATDEDSLSLSVSAKHRNEFQPAALSTVICVKERLMQTFLKVLWVLVSFLAGMIVIVSLPDNWGEEMKWLEFVMFISTATTIYGSVTWSFPKRLRSGLAGEISAFLCGTIKVVWFV